MTRRLLSVSIMGTNKSWYHSLCDQKPLFTGEARLEHGQNRPRSIKSTVSSNERSLHMCSITTATRANRLQDEYFSKNTLRSTTMTPRKAIYPRTDRNVFSFCEKHQLWTVIPLLLRDEAVTSDTFLVRRKHRNGAVRNLGKCHRPRSFLSRRTDTIIQHDSGLQRLRQTAYRVCFLGSHMLWRACDGSPIAICVLPPV